MLKKRLAEYCFWGDVLTTYKHKDCPLCGGKMGARKVGKENRTLYLCSSCVYCESIFNEEKRAKYGARNIWLR